MRSFRKTIDFNHVCDLAAQGKTYAAIAGAFGMSKVGLKGRVRLERPDLGAMIDSNGRRVWGQGCRKLDDAKAFEMRSKGATLERIASEFGCSETAVRTSLRGRPYRGVGR